MPQGRVRTAKTPRIASWATLSRPFGTGFVGGVLTQTLEPDVFLVVLRQG
jgi:hypothetical protein